MYYAIEKTCRVFAIHHNGEAIEGAEVKSTEQSIVTREHASEVVTSMVPEDELTEALKILGLSKVTGRVTRDE